MQKSSLIRSLTLIGFTSSVFVHVASAQTCLNGNSMLNSTYAFFATEAGASSASSGSGSSKPSYSNTELGNLLGSIAAASPFSATGVLTFDGAGHVLASAVPQGGLNVIVGSYSINPDCTITISLTDAFGTTTTPQSLMGIVLNAGTEVDLGPVPAAAGSASNQSASSLTITLTRPLYPSGCSVSNLSGAYALVSKVTFQAVAFNPPGTGTLLTLAVVDFDGGGNIVAQPVAAGSPLGMFQYTGTYTINSDCSGTITLSSGPGASGSLVKFPGAPLTINFAVTAPSVSVGTTPTADQTRPGLTFVISNGTQTAAGYGRPL